jgi:hypothetical protein
MGHPCPASDESTIHYNTRHTDPGSGAGAPDPADQSLDVRVLPRRSGSSRLVPNAHGTHPLPEDQAPTSSPGWSAVPRARAPIVSITLLVATTTLPTRWLVRLIRSSKSALASRVSCLRRGMAAAHGGPTTRSILASGLRPPGMLSLAAHRARSRPAATYQAMKQGGGMDLHLSRARCRVD